MKIGLLGASWIAPQAIIDPASIVAGAQISAVAARDAKRAEAYAETYGIAKAFGSYGALLADPETDVVYISLPPSLHAHWSILALQAGKHVICEKPLAMTLAEAMQMAKAAQASGKRLIEAFHSRYHPAFETCLAWVQAGQIGTVQTMVAHFGVGIADDGRKNQYRPELGGGSLMDMGCYPLHWVRQFAGAEIAAVRALAVGAGSGVDESMKAALTFENGVTADISCSMHPETPFGSGLEITGSKGKILFENPLVPHQGGALTLQTERGTIKAPVSTVTTYCYQLQRIQAALQDGTPLPTEGLDQSRQQAAIDWLYKDAGLGHLRRTP